MGNADWTFYPKLLLTKGTIDVFFLSFLWHKILVLIFNMFIYVNVGHSKFVKMHGDGSDFYRSALVFYTRHRVNITIYLSNCLHTHMLTLMPLQLINKLWTTVALFHCCNLIWGLTNNNYSLYLITYFKVFDCQWQCQNMFVLYFHSLAIFSWTVQQINRDIFLLLKTTQIWVITICVVLDQCTVIFQKEGVNYK